MNEDEDSKFFKSSNPSLPINDDLCHKYKRYDELRPYRRQSRAAINYLNCSNYYYCFVVFALFVVIFCLTILISRPSCSDSYTFDDDVYHHQTIFQSPKTPVCLFKKKGEYDPKISWTKREICQEFQYTTNYNIYAPSTNTTTSAYKIASVCGIQDPRTLRYHYTSSKESDIIQHVLSDSSQPAIGICSPQSIQSYITDGTAELINVDGKTCFDDYGYFLDMYLYLSINS